MKRVSRKAAMSSAKQTSEPWYETYELYRNLLDNMLEGCQILGRDWRYIYLNPTAEVQNRRPNLELLGNLYMEMWPGIEATHVFAEIKRCMEERTAIHLENRFAYPDGRIGWFDLSIQPVPEGVFILSIDVTEKKLAEQAYIASQKRFQALIENAPDGIALLGADGKLRQLTPSSEQILGYSMNDVEGTDPALLTHPQDLPALLNLLNDLLQNPGKVVRTEYRFRHKNGSWHWLDSIISNLMAEPSVEAIVFNYRDITERKQIESELLGSEEKFRRIAETIDEVFWMADSVISKMLYISPAYETIWGRTTQSLYETPQSFIEAIHPEDREHALAMLSLQSTGVPFSHEYRIVRPDGSIRWIWDRAFPVPDEEGNATRYVGVAVDVTDRKHADEMLRQATAYTESVLAGIADSHLLLDREWHYLYVNEACVRAMGLPREQILGHTLWELYPDIIGTELEREYHRAMDERVTASLEFHYQSPDTWWDNHFYPVPEGLAVFATDITERKRAEESLLKSEDRYRDLVDNSHDLICTHDLDGNLLSVNPYAAQVLGFTTGELLGMNMRDVLTPETQKYFRRYLSSVRENGIARGVMHVLTSSGETRVWEYRNTLRTEGVTIPIVRGMARDVTEQRMAEERLKQSERDLAEAQKVARIGSWSRDLRTGVVRWSDEMRAIFGVERAALVDYNTFISRIHPEDVSRVEQDTQRALTAGDEFKHEFRIVLSTGENKTVEEVGHRVTDSTGNVTGLFGTAQDITERKQAEDQVRYQAALLANINEAVVASDASFRITSWNQAAEAMFGWKTEDVLGRDIREVLKPADALQEMWIDDAAGDHSQAELSVVCKDGTPISIETSYMNMRDAAGHITARIGVSRDIAERKHAQERERQQMQRLLALREIDAAITSSFDQRFTLSMLLTQVTTSLGVDAADVLMLDPFLNTLDFVAGRGFDELPGRIAVPLTAYHAGEAARERRILIESDLQRSERPFARKAMITRERFKAYCVVPLVAKGEIKGVLEVFHRSVLAPDSEWLDFLETLARQAAIAIDNSQLFEGLQRSNFELALAYDGTIEGWSRALDLRDKETEGHTQRVTALTVALARRLKFADKDIVHIRRGGLLHDIGKMGVPDAILLKPGPLTDEEWVAMKKHPIFAFELLSPIRYLKSAAIDIPYCHHEKWDGTGYPRGLKGEQIPLSARIFSVVDVWDALTSDRPYRPAWPREKVLEHVRSLSGSHFDPMVVQEFLAMIIEGK